MRRDAADVPDTPQERWQRVEALVDEALDKPVEERTKFLRNACADDAELLAAATKWLEACDDPARFPSEPAAAFAAPILSGSPRDDSENDLPESRRVGAYRIVRELGRGGMGTVYLAERDDGQLDRSVAVKLMRHGTGNDDRLRRRFLDERQILARLDHPNIATLIDGGVTDDGRLYFVMLYIEGLQIDRYCDDMRLSIAERLRIFVSVCRAVQHAHSHQIVHRDLKPGNILVTTDGQPKLLDFGIAKLLEREAQELAEQTRTGERLLTPEYASPEQIRGEGVTPASDVHALGVLLHRLLTGQRPFRRRAGTPYELERAILDEEPTQPSDAVSDAGERRKLRGDLDAIVLTALRKAASDRYADAGLLADDIERHLNGLPVRARGRGFGYRMRRFAQRNRRLVAAASVGMFLGAALLAISLTRTNGSTDANTVTAAVLAIGRIADYRDGVTSEAAAPLADMLATNLARTEGLAVISAGRMYTLVNQGGAEKLLTDESYARAALAAGATEIVSGAIYSTPSGGVRLDLQRVNVADGTIRGAYTANGSDLFALADSATINLVAGLGLAAPRGSIADVTTRSLDAYAAYTQGLHHFFSGKTSAADSAFGAAIRADSSFAMAWYYYAKNTGYQWRFSSATIAAREEFEGRFAHALSLSANASDRERLMIRTYYEVFHLSPSMRAVAETLAVRYPQEPDGHLALGISYGLQGEFAAAIPHFERVLALDSTSLRPGVDDCASCEAISNLMEAYLLLDSLPVAERYARYWLRAQPESPIARSLLVQVLDAQGRHTDGTELLNAGDFSTSSQDSILILAKHWIRSGQFGTADTLLQRWINSVSGPSLAPLLYFKAVLLRNEGKLDDALAVAREMRRVAGDPRERGAAPPSALVQAQTLFDLGLFRNAEALFDSISRWRTTDQPQSVDATLRVQALSMVAASRFAAGDTNGLGVIADSLEHDGLRSYLFRPRDQHHFVRGLVAVARGDDVAAVSSFGRALAAVNSDFGRASMALADIYMKQSRPTDAVAILRPLTRGWFMETTNLHITLTEIHEKLALAYDAAGVGDSALVYWRRVARDWAGADEQFAARRVYAQSRIRAAASRVP